MSSIALLMACNQRPDNVVKVDMQPNIYPDYVGVEIPSGIAPLNFCMEDKDIDNIDVTIKGSIEGEMHANGRYADFDIDDWHILTEANKGGILRVTVCALKDNRWVQYADFEIYVSQQEIKEWGVTYRLVAPGYEIYGKMGLYQRALGNFDEQPIVVNTQLLGMCVNCHTTNASNPMKSVMHVRGSNGATVVHDNNDVECLVAKNAQLGSSMVYPYWHPSGKYVAFSTNDTQQMFHSKAEKLIEVFDATSDIILYEPASHTITPLFNDTAMAENLPVFSPDGSKLYYISAPIMPTTDEYDKMRYSLYATDFDVNTGKVGSDIDTLIDARVAGKSITWPRPSPDGRYIMYTTVDYGYFSIWHPEADLWLYDIATRECKPLDKVNSHRAESFHSWSVGGNWFLFTSRRADDLYTRLFFAHIDDEGKVSKPFMLPQQNPYEDNVMCMFSYNTPDFISEPIDISKKKLSDAVNDRTRTNTIY